jgi:hypothetical protein
MTRKEMQEEQMSIFEIELVLRNYMNSDLK